MQNKILKIRLFRIVCRLVVRESAKVKAKIVQNFIIVKLSLSDSNKVKFAREDSEKGGKKMKNASKISRILDVPRRLMTLIRACSMQTNRISYVRKHLSADGGRKKWNLSIESAEKCWSRAGVSSFSDHLPPYRSRGGSRSSARIKFNDGLLRLTRSATISSVQRDASRGCPR